MATTLPCLLPERDVTRSQGISHLEWTPKKYRTAPQPPPMDDVKVQELEMASARQMMDGKLIKKTRPRRTVDYNGGMGRWALVSDALSCIIYTNHTPMQLRKLRPNPLHVPYLRPSAPYIIDVGRCIAIAIKFFDQISTSAPTTESIPRQFINFALYQIRSHLNEQNQMSRKRGYGQSP